MPHKGDYKGMKPTKAMKKMAVKKHKKGKK